MKTIEEASILSFKVYAIEVKKDEEEFEIYNPNLTEIHLCLWRDEYEGKDESAFKYEVIKVDRTKDFSQVKDKILETFNFDIMENLYVFKKIDTHMNHFNISQLSFNEEDLGKSVFLNGIFEGTTVYIEKKDENWRKSHFSSVIIFN